MGNPYTAALIHDFEDLEQIAKGALEGLQRQYPDDQENDDEIEDARRCLKSIIRRAKAGARAVKKL